MKKLEVSERDRSLTSVFGQRFIDIVEEDLRGLSRPDASETSVCSARGAGEDRALKVMRSSPVADRFDGASYRDGSSDRSHANAVDRAAGESFGLM